MTTKLITANCQDCESSYSIEYEAELVSTELPENCPFCGEPIEELAEQYIEDYEPDDNEDWE